MLGLRGHHEELLAESVATMFPCLKVRPNKNEATCTMGANERMIAAIRGINHRGDYSQ